MTRSTAIALRMDDGTTAYALQHRFRDMKKTAQEMNEGQTVLPRSQVFPSLCTAQHSTYLFGFEILILTSLTAIAQHYNTENPPDGLATGVAIEHQF